MEIDERKIKEKKNTKKAVEVWTAVVEVWIATSLAMAASRRSTQAVESSVSAIEKWQVGPIVGSGSLKFETKDSLQEEERK